MAATVAGLIRGRDVVADAQSLSIIAAAQLDVDGLAFSEVIDVLENADFVQGVRRQGRKILSFTETVPYYDDLYGKLGKAWRDREPTILEQQLLVVVDKLSAKPIPFEDLENAAGLDKSDIPLLLKVGTDAGLVQTIRSIDGDIAYSPFFGFENPALLEELVQNHGSGRLAEEFAAIRGQQGLPINSATYPLLTDAVARGLVMAPTVTLPNGADQQFAALPYVPDTRLLTSRKPIVEKALAILACLRCAQHYGGYSSLSASGLINVIGKLLDPNRGFLYPNSAHKRQYALMRNAGIIYFAPDTRAGGSWVTPTFVDSQDNREALNLARDLILFGEGLTSRVDDADARSALDLGTGYSAPMQTMHRTRDRVMPTSEHLEKIFEAAMGRAEL
ncbi:hypothetical protein [Rhodococcus sp. IEGM 1330]|uniref:hypothetical protein n=1 Tax=Rhodococcus sp. IEGM 1330 TaxID=3082225 RepID=UPI00295448CB|nr:hypothetical protein [Rhodococcus sp. IEGM 1330]MDV8025340.1 hypothetical protein [Rhodococcus sp. IEGM 1330]